MKQDRIAAKLLEVFRDIWCESNETETGFNCSRCEFTDGENCLIKIFIKSKTKETDPPTVLIAPSPCVDGVKA